MMALPVISHYQQPCQKSCVSTSIAMCLELPVKMVVEQWHEEYFIRDGSIKDILDFYEIPFIVVPSYSRHPFHGMPDSVALVSVPSLNYRAGMHTIAAAYDGEGKVWQLFDPQAGNEECAYYTAGLTEEDKAEWPNAVAIESYVVEAIITEEDRRNWIKTKQVKHIDNWLNKGPVTRAASPT